MHDQAHTLRRLVRDYVRADAPQPCPRPAVLLIAGAVGGVGTTSVALNLAVAFQQLSRPATLVQTAATANELALRAGPGGIQILAASPTEDRRRPPACDGTDPRWITELAHVVPATEIVVVDAGHGPSTILRSLWGTGDAALLVTSPDPTSLVGGYTLLKLLHGTEPRPAVYGLVNRATNAAVAGTVFGRMHRACLRFLALELRPAGFVPHEPALDPAKTPLVLGSTACPARERLVRAASTLNEGLQAARTGDFSVISCQERFNLETKSDRYTRTLSVAEQPLNYVD